MGMFALPGSSSSLTLCKIDLIFDKKGFLTSLNFDFGENAFLHENFCLSGPWNWIQITLLWNLLWFCIRNELVAPIVVVKWIGMNLHKLWSFIRASLLFSHYMTISLVSISSIFANKMSSLCLFVCLDAHCSVMLPLFERPLNLLTLPFLHFSIQSRNQTARCRWQLDSTEW